MACLAGSFSWQMKVYQKEMLSVKHEALYLYQLGK